MGLSPQLECFALTPSLQFYVEQSCVTVAHDHLRLPGASGTPNCWATTLTDYIYAMAVRTEVFII